MTLPFFSTQLPGKTQVAVKGQQDINWSYDDMESGTISPAKFFGDGVSYPHKVYPVPCYGHDLSQVEELLAVCNDKAPLCNPVSVTVMRVIDKAQTNGWAQQVWDYSCHTPEDCQCDITHEGKGLGKRNWDGVICLSGRSTEIHPAIARYVVPHEYGHIVEDALGIIRYRATEQKGDHGHLLLEEWKKVRRFPEFDLKGKSYGPETHHLMPGEVFANDFRFVLGFETEWWPHAEVVPPLGARGTVKAVRWWNDALDQLKDCYSEAQRSLIP